jgi:DNA-binding HxlR family transcriptional regulator
MARPEDVFNKQCGTRDVLDLLSDKWTVLIVGALASGVMRYGQLKRKIDGVSHKMLTQTIRRLERDGIVKRTVYPVVPPKVEYTLTPLGQTLIEPLTALCIWAAEHLPEVESARKEYEERSRIEVEIVG